VPLKSYNRKYNSTYLFIGIPSPLFSYVISPCLYTATNPPEPNTNEMKKKKRREIINKMKK
jgi:hypothetical protein